MTSMWGVSVQIKRQKILGGTSVARERAESGGSILGERTATLNRSNCSCDRRKPHRLLGRTRELSSRYESTRRRIWGKSRGVS